MRKLRFQELRQLAYCYPVHLAHAIVGATDNEDISRQIFVKVLGIFFMISTIISALLYGSKQSQRPSQVKGTLTSPPDARRTKVTLSEEHEA